jgi:hypothetical protein
MREEQGAGVKSGATCANAPAPNASERNNILNGMKPVLHQALITPRGVSLSPLPAKSDFETAWAAYLSTQPHSENTTGNKMRCGYFFNKGTDIANDKDKAGDAGDKLSRLLDFCMETAVEYFRDEKLASNTSLDRGRGNVHNMLVLLHSLKTGRRKYRIFTEGRITNAEAVKELLEKLKSKKAI